MSHVCRNAHSAGVVQIFVQGCACAPCVPYSWRRADCTCTLLSLATGIVCQSDGNRHELGQWSLERNGLSSYSRALCSASLSREEPSMATKRPASVTTKKRAGRKT